MDGKELIKSCLPRLLLPVVAREAVLVLELRSDLRPT